MGLSSEFSRKLAKRIGRELAVILLSKEAGFGETSYAKELRNPGE